MRTEDTGIYDNRVRFAIRRMAGLFGACIFIAGGIVAAFDDRFSPITAGFFLFFGILIGAIPLLFRTGKEAPGTKVIDERYGTFLPSQTDMNASLMVYASLTLVFYGLAVAGFIRMFFRPDWASAIMPLLVAIGLGTLMANAARGTLNARKRKNIGLFLTPGGIHLLERLHPVKIRWEEIERIHPHWKRSGRFMHPVKNWLTFERGTNADHSYRDVFELMSGTPEPTIELDSLNGDPRKIVAGFEYFLNNPAARNELGTSMAITRFTD